jgi:hypothetical protein
MKSFPAKNISRHKETGEMLSPHFQTPGEAFCFLNLSEYSAAARTSLPPPFLVNREPLYLQPAFLTAAFML